MKIEVLTRIEAKIRAEVERDLGTALVTAKKAYLEVVQKSSVKEGWCDSYFNPPDVGSAGTQQTNLINEVTKRRVDALLEKLASLADLANIAAEVVNHVEEGN